MTRRARAGERGAAVVDFVLVLLVLLPLVLGILQLALVLHVRNTLASAAAEGARHAAVAGSSAPAGQAKVQDLIDEALSQDFVRSVDVHPALVGGAPGYEAVVEAEVTVLGLGGTGVRVRVEGHAVAEQAAVGAVKRRDETGSALIEFSWLAIILIVPLIWIVISVFEVQQGAFATSAAARAAGRAYALAPDDATGDARARAAAEQVLADQGTPGQRGRVEITCEAPGDHCHVGTSVITVVVDSGVELPFFPAILGNGAASFSLDATHTVPIGQYVESEPEDGE